MKSFYSLIKIAPNALSDDNLTIGIILSDGNGYKVKFSSSKITLAKSLVDINKDLFDFLTKEIDKKIKETNALLKKSDSDLFGYENLINSEYFKYLSVYSNGILKFTNPNLISGDVSEKDFMKLYHLLVDGKEKSRDNIEIKKIEKEFYNRVNVNLIQRVEGQIHTNVTLTSKIIPATPRFEIDCIGKNGSLVGAKSLPFTQTKETLLKTVNNYISVIAQLSVSYSQDLVSNRFYLIADEPSKKNTQEAKYWNQIWKNEKLFQVITSSESGLIAETIESKNARTFIEGLK